MLRFGPIALLFLALFAASAIGASSAQATVSVAYLQGELRLVEADRPGDGLDAALAALFAGPTAAERKAEIRTYLPKTSPLISAQVSGSTATVDFTDKLVATRDPVVLRFRLTQIVGTVTAQPGITKARVLINGGAPFGLFPGIDASKALTLRGLATPTVKPPLPVPDPTTVPTESTRDLQNRLIALGYLPSGAADGKAGPQTTNAVIAFQKWSRLGRDGTAGPQTLKALAGAKRPTPLTQGAGRRAEVLLDRQLVLAIENNRIVRVMHTSTGTSATPTPVGRYSVYGQFARWWSVPFQSWLPWSSAFVGGIAFHEYPSVPVQPASHGCVRLSQYDAEWFFRFLSVGDAVTVIDRS